MLNRGCESLLLQTISVIAMNVSLYKELLLNLPTFITMLKQDKRANQIKQASPFKNIGPVLLKIYIPQL